MKRLLPLFLLVVSLVAAHAADLTFYIGTYNKAGSKGIYRCALDSETGKLGPVQLAAEAASPSFLAMTPDGKFLYAASDGNGGSIIAFKVENDGNLTMLNQQQAVKGGGIAHVWYDRYLHDVLGASYGGGSVVAFKTNPDGSLTERTGFEQFSGSGPNKDRQGSPHAHSVYTSALATHPQISDDARVPVFAYACDLGTDKIWIFRLSNDGKLVANNPPFSMVPPGSGPRHLAFHPYAHYAYVANEMGHTVTAFSVVLKDGSLKQIQDISTLPASLKYDGTITTAEIYCHHSGKWLYVSNRDVGNQGHDSIAVFSIADDGKLTWIQDVPSPVKIPRGMGLDPTGHWLVVAGQDDNKISPLKIDQETGKLTPTGQFVEAGSPVCIQFAPLAPAK